MFGPIQINDQPKGTEMAATQQQTGNRSQTASKSLLDQVLEQPVGKRFLEIDAALQGRVDRIEELLPANMKGEGARLAKRAIMTLNRRADDYANITPTSFIRCVLEAAEFGLAIDGRFAHAVPFNNKVKDADGREKKVREVQLMVDYKGIVAVARRNGIIADCWGRLVCVNDVFRIFEEDGQCKYHHEPALTAPGPIIGVIAVVKFPDGSWRHEWMNIADLDAIRARSKAWQAGGGPWKTDDGEMKKKTCIKRVMKMYTDDQQLAKLLEMDDRDYEETRQPETVKVPARRQKVKDFAPSNGHAPAAIPTTAAADSEDDDGEVDDKSDGGAGDANEWDEDVAEQAAMDIQNAIDSAENAAEMREVGAQLKAAKATLGAARHDALLKTVQEKNKKIGTK